MDTETKGNEAQEKRRKWGKGRVWARGSVLWIRYYDAAGRQRSESARTSDPDVAEKLLDKRIGAKLNDILPPPRKVRVTVAQLYKDEIAYLKKNRKQTDWVKSCWELRLRDFFGARRAREIRRADLEEYQSHRMEAYRREFPDASQKKLLACETAVNKDLAVLRMILYRGRALEKLDTVPPFPPKLPGAMERTGTISDEQFSAMLQACGPGEVWLKTLLTMAHTWGYRLRELLKLRCLQVNLAERIVYLPPRSTKNKHARPVPISDRELPLLRACLAGKNLEDAVFTRADGTPVADFRCRWEKLVDASGAGHFTIDENGRKNWVRAVFHDFRRTAITNMLAGGVPAANVRALVGHFSEEMTARYNRPQMDTLRQLREAASIRLAALNAPQAADESRIVAEQGQFGDNGSLGAPKLLSGSGGIGRRAGLRILWPKGRVGSNPTFRTN